MYVGTSVIIREFYAHYQTFPEKKPARPVRDFTTFITLNIKLKKNPLIPKKYKKLTYYWKSVNEHKKSAKKHLTCF